MIQRQEQTRTRQTFFPQTQTDSQVGRRRENNLLLRNASNYWTSKQTYSWVPFYIDRMGKMDDNIIMNGFTTPTWGQRDQIGLFFKAPGNKFSYKSRPNIWWHLKYKLFWHLYLLQLLGLNLDTFKSNIWSHCFRQLGIISIVYCYRRNGEKNPRTISFQKCLFKILKQQTTTLDVHPNLRLLHFPKTNKNISTFLNCLSAK